MDYSVAPKERLKKLFEQGGNVSINNNIPIQRYFRSGEEMMRMANVYFDEKQYEAAYLLFAKFITLFFEKIKSHPQLKSVPLAARKTNKASLKVAFAKAEKIKAILEEQYEIEHMKWKTEQERLRIIEEERIEHEKKKKEHEKKMEAKAMLDKEKEQMEFFVEQQRRKQLEDERLAIEAKFQDSRKQDDGNAPLIPVDFAPPPAWQKQEDNSRPQPSAPVVAPQVPQPLPRPTVDRSVKPQRLTEPGKYNPPEPQTNGISSIYGPAISSTVSVTKNKYGLRTVIVPQALAETFMRYAKTNTDRNIETCGVLFGNLSQNMFVITHVLLPHQSGTSESCNTTREEDLWEFQEHYNGICLGWIHTHPSQTAFLSSVDLHTHYPYQCLMAESVAIVCSGKYKETGYFMISPGRGMSDIGRCSKVGHHPHQNNPPLFETCDHVQVSGSHKVEFVDWRRR